MPHLDAAYTLARFLVRNDHDAEDLVQDACLRALRYFDSYRGGDVRAWLLAIVRRTCFTWIARQSPVHDMAEFDESRHGQVAVTPETDLDRGALGDAITRALDALPREYREVVLLRELEGLSYQEMADALAVPIGTVMSRLARARRRLQAALPLAEFGGG